MGVRGTKKTLKFVAGAACLDFANTLWGRKRGGTWDGLSDYAALIAWSVQARLLGRATARALETAAAEQPRPAATVLERGISLREAIYRLFSAIAADQTAPANALRLVNTEATEAMRHARIVAGPRQFSWQIKLEASGLYLPLHLVAQATAELLTSANVNDVRECAVHPCTWLFLDKTKNHSRLWCDMRSCGNRAKQARFRERSQRQNDSKARLRAPTPY